MTVKVCHLTSALHLDCTVSTSVTKIALLHTISFLLRPRSTPTPTGSISANGVPTEALDYDRLKQVLLKINK